MCAKISHSLTKIVFNTISRYLLIKQALNKLSITCKEEDTKLHKGKKQNKCEHHAQSCCSCWHQLHLNHTRINACALHISFDADELARIHALDLVLRPYMLLFVRGIHRCNIHGQYCKQVHIRALLCYVPTLCLSIRKLIDGTTLMRKKYWKQGN
jgi:hypothetical protein